MHKNKPRPVYLHLLQIRQPIGAIASIAHRITGVFLVLALPAALYFLRRSLESPETYLQVTEWLVSTSGRATVLVVFWLFAQHFYSGLRHLLLDIDIGVDIGPARKSAWLTFVASLATVLIFGIALL